MRTTTQEYSEKINHAYVAAGVLLGAVGIVLALTVPTADVIVRPVDGVSIFAVLYLIAMAAERVTEFGIMALSWALPSAEGNRALATSQVRAAQTGIVSAIAASGQVSTDTKEKAKEKADRARQALAVFGGGSSLLLCAGMVLSTDYLLLSAVGLTGVDERIDAVVTTLAAAGGSKGLHETISRIQKAKEKSDET